MTKHLWQKRFFAILLSMLLLFSNCLNATALSEDDITSPAAVLMDAKSGKILFEKNAHEQRP